MTSVRIKETIYTLPAGQNVRYGRMPATWQGFTRFLSTSPHAPCRGDREAMGANHYLARAFAQLLTTGRASHGWATFDID